MSLKIVDISNYQPNYTPGSTDEDIVWVMATQGVGFTSPTLSNQVQALVSSGKRLGLYHFYNGGNTPTDEAEYFWQVVQPYLQYNPALILDYEIKEEDQASSIKNFVIYLKEKAKCPIWVYVQRSLAHVASEVDSPLWLAFYPYESSEASPATWDAPLDRLDEIGSDVSAWQFTTSGGQLDRSLFFGDMGQYDKLTYQGNASVDTTPTAPSQDLVKNNGNKHLSDFADEVLDGIWGDGNDRKENLGLIYNSVQAYVEFKLGNIDYDNLISTLVDEIMAGNIGDGQMRLDLLGIDYNAVQAKING